MGAGHIKMTGACGTCPAAEEELSGSIKDTLMMDCPEVRDVKLDQRISEDMLDFAKQLLNKR